jgi:hypothetical protein
VAEHGHRTTREDLATKTNNSRQPTAGFIKIVAACWLSEEALVGSAIKKR